jgi:hypothetical protein
MRGAIQILLRGACDLMMFRSLTRLAKAIRAPICFAIVSPLIAIVGCVALESVREVRLKDGKPGLATSCIDAKDCDHQAFMACVRRSGYIKYDEVEIRGLVTVRASRRTSAIRR